MQPYDDLRKHCENNKLLNWTIIDQYLIQYAGERMSLVPEMEAAIRRYKHAASGIPDAQLNYLRSEYIAHRIFKKNGLIHKLLKHSALQRFSAEEMEFLRTKSENPWRFSIAEIASNPDDSFFMMADVMTGDEYLLFSPGMEATLKEYKPRLWFNLIEFNGFCWQTYGLIIPFIAFSVDDIFFFATEVNPKIENEEMLMAEVERNPMPFFMLISAAFSPYITSHGHLSVICQAGDIIPDLPTEKLDKKFKLATIKNLHQFTLKGLEMIPHFARAYYDEYTGELFRTSMTKFGFEKLTKELLKIGLDLSPEPDVSVSPVMLIAAEKVLNRKIVLDRFEKYFSEKTEESDDLKGINTFLALALPVYNAGKEVDIAGLAAKAGIDPAMAADFWKQVKQKTDEMRNKKY